MPNGVCRNPRVSICIPTYNGREHLKECIDSVLAQTFQDFEVMVCDDQSSDGTLDHARELAGGDRRFRFIQNPRRFGLVGNWNQCIAESRGEWIKFVFQDDIIAPACVEKLLLACERTGKTFGFCARAFIFDDGVPEGVRNWLSNHQQRLQSDYQSCPVIAPQTAARVAVREPLHNLVGEPTVTLIKRTVFAKLGFFDEALIQACDGEFWARVMIHHGAVFIPESLAIFRVHAKAMTAWNHNVRKYRTEILDELVLRYRMAFGQHFKPARHSQLTGKGILSLRLDCASNAAHAWRFAKKAGKNPGEQSCYGNLKEWDSTVAHCHGLQSLAQIGRVVNLYRRIKYKIQKGQE